MKIKALWLSLLFCSSLLFAASYPPQMDYGDRGDFIVKLGTEFGRTADLMLIGPILANLPEHPGSSTVAIDEFRPEDTIWDLSDLTNPTFTRSYAVEGRGLRQPILAHGTLVAFHKEFGPMLWAGDDWWHFDPDKDISDPTNDLIVEAPGVWQPRPLSYPMMFSPYYARHYWEYGFDTEGLYAIRDTTQLLQDTSQTEWLGESENQVWLGEPLVAWDHLGLTGVTGFTSWFGNLLVVASDQQSTGMAIYDVSGYKDGIAPRLLSVFDPQLVEPEHEGVVNTIGIGGYWVEPYGTNKMVWAARKRVQLTPSRRHAAMFVVDFTDPTAPFLSCAIYFNQDVDDPLDGDLSSDPLYVNFQDNFVYMDHFKVDLDACETAFDDGEISRDEISDIVYKFDDIANNCDSSQYFRPLGQVGIFGGYDYWDTPTINEQGMCFFVTSDEPDTNPPYISGHRPLDGQINYPVDGFISLHIPETLRTETVMDAITITDEDNGEVSFRHILSHTGTITVWPDQDLEMNTPYRVSVSGIQDFMGNTMAPYSFTFSTGDTIGDIGIPVPEPGDSDIAPSFDGDAYYPNQSSQLACEPEVDNGNVWVVNPDNDSITIIDRNTDASTFEVTHTVIGEVNLSYETPTSVTKLGSDFVVTHRDDDKVVIYSAAGIPVRTIDTGYGTQPESSIAVNGMLYVALYGSGEIISIDSTNWAIIQRLTVGPTPKAMAAFNNRLLVTRFISNSEYGEIYDIDLSSGLSLTRIIQANKVLVEDDQDHGSGIPNYLSSIVISSDASIAYVTANKVNVDRGSQRNGLPLDGDNTVRPIMIILDLVNNCDSNIDPTTRENTIDLDNGADPSGVTFLANSNIRVHSLRGNDVVVVQNLIANTSAQFNVGSAPMSMCTTLRTLYVKNFAGRSVSAIDVSGFMYDGSLSPTIEEIPTVTTEAMTGQELRGLTVFYASLIPEMGPEGYMSCSSCHFGGGGDGVVWDISSMGEGFRNTISLTGTSGTRFGNLHWSANFDQVQDFEIQMENLNGGEGLIPGITFNNQSPLDYDTSTQNADLDALAAYIESLGKDTVKRSPHRDYIGELTESAARGRDLFYADSCEQCHAGSAFRDGLTHDVGTIVGTSGSRLGGILDAIRTPTLIELWESAPYFHDGSAATLSDVLNRGTHTRNLSTQDEIDLIAFLNSIDRSDFIDDSAVFSPGAPPLMSDLTISEGSGTGRYPVGATISIESDEPPLGLLFFEWTGDIDTIEDTSSASTSVVITETELSLTATFEVDSLPPTAPGSLIFSNVSSTSISLEWVASADNVGVVAYIVLLNGVEFGNRIVGSSLSTQVFDLDPATQYDISIIAIDALGNQSGISNVISIETLDPTNIRNMRSYYFGDSSIYHTYNNYLNKDELSVPHWVYKLAESAEQEFYTDGEFRLGSYQYPAINQWAFSEAPSAWNGSFVETTYDSVVYTDNNNIQYREPDELYLSDRIGTPFSAALALIDNIRTDKPGITFYLYENWPVAYGFAPNYDQNVSGSGPTSEQFDQFHAYARGGNHEWWASLQDMLSAQRDNVKLLPVGFIISGLLTEIPALAGIPFEDLYEDREPHGRPTIFFLAAMVQYTALYNQRAPVDFSVPSVIDSAVADNYADIVDYIWDELNAFNFPGGESRVW